MNRRNFLKVASAALILPAIVKAENIMRINPPGIIRRFDLCEYMDDPGRFHFKVSDTSDFLEIYSNNTGVYTLIWQKPGMGRLVPGSRSL